MFIKNSLIRSCLQIYLPFLLAGILWDRLSGSNLTDSFFYIVWSELGLGFLAGLGLVLFTYLSFKLFPSLKKMEEFFFNILGQLSFLQILSVALLSGLTEEILFRGILLHYTGFWISSILFGIMHFPVKKTLIPWTVFAILVGFLFAYLMISFNNLAMVSAAHFTVNFINLLLLNKKNPFDPERKKLSVI